jgi:hypothetical protein
VISNSQDLADCGRRVAHKDQSGQLACSKKLVTSASRLSTTSGSQSVEMQAPTIPNQWMPRDRSATAVTLRRSDCAKSRMPAAAGAAYNRGYVNARALARRAHLSWLASGECAPPAGADRPNSLVGKQSTISNRNTSRSIFNSCEWSSFPRCLRSCRSFAKSLTTSCAFKEVLRGPVYCRTAAVIAKQATHGRSNLARQAGT